MPGYSELVQALRGGKGPGDMAREGMAGFEQGQAQSREEQKAALQKKVSSFLAGELGASRPPTMDPSRPLSEAAFLGLSKDSAQNATDPDEAAAYLDAVNTGRAALGMDPVAPEKPLSKGAANALLRGMSVATQAPAFGAEKKRQVAVVAELPALRDVSLAVNRVTQAWKPEFTGPGDVLTQEAASATGNANPQYVNLVQGIATAFNKIAKAQSGAVINQEELARLADQFPRKWKTDADFVARINAWISDFNNVVDMNAKSAGPNVRSQYNSLKLKPIVVAAQQPVAKTAPGVNDDAKTRRMIELGLIEGN